MAYSKYTQPIEQGLIYHVFNKAIGDEHPFQTSQECLHFLDKLSVKVSPVAEIYAYVVMSNHFHLMVKVTGSPDSFSRAVAELCVSHAKWYNKRKQRQGGLFLSPFRRRLATDEASLSWLPWYIHRNPLHHGVTENWRHYQWSSYREYLSGQASIIHPYFLIKHYGSLESLKEHHELNASAWEAQIE